MPDAVIILHPDYIKDLCQKGCAHPMNPDVPLIEGELMEIAPLGMVRIQRNLPKTTNWDGAELLDVHTREGMARAELSRIGARGRRRR